MMTRPPATLDGDSRLGATVQAEGVHFAVWAPAAELVEVELDDGRGTRHHLLNREADGLHRGFVPQAAAGTRYRYRLDRGAAYPDPASRFQPEGVHGPSEVVDPSRFRWRDEDWSGRSIDELVIYEVHVGTATLEGTFNALTGRLSELAELGVTAIELMPVADFPGRWNWGYDGVDWWAPSRAYGRPDDLRRLVDRAHQVGLAVILDVVYNHFGPDGAYWRSFSADYFTSRHETPWGDGINYDGPYSHWVRELVLQSACHWISEYHIDGFRLDATHAIADESPQHILAELSERARAAASPRQITLIAENEQMEPRLLQPVNEGGCGLDAIWADDFHHAMRVLLTGEAEGYYAAFAGTTREVCQIIERGMIESEPGGDAPDRPYRSFVFCLQNHDQVGNRAFGERLHHQIDRDRYAVASAVLLFVPETPLLFMGQEYAASTPFTYFTDFDEELGQLITEGRRAEFAGFRAFGDPFLRDSIPDPQAAQTFDSSVLDEADRAINARILLLYRELLTLRRDDPVLHVAERTATRACAAGAQMMIVHRWHEAEHLVLVANVGAATDLSFSSTAGLREVPDGEWRLLLSTAETRFGGGGRASAVGGDGQERRMTIPARTAVIYAVTAGLPSSS
jgi:maltooligosyltrehalose trehalohydrolase